MAFQFQKVLSDEEFDIRFDKELLAMFTCVKH